jgi:hypothetical protein
MSDFQSPCLKCGGFPPPCPLRDESETCSAVLPPNLEPMTAFELALAEAEREVCGDE